MIRKRVLTIGFAAAASIGVIVAVTWPLALTMAYSAGVEEVSPDKISWDGKTAWKRCDSAINGRSKWPDEPQKACAAMHMCANEAQLTDRQSQLLDQAIRATPSCPSP